MELADVEQLQAPEILQVLREAAELSPDQFVMQHARQKEWPLQAMAEQLQCRAKWKDKLPHFLEAQLLGTAESSEQASSLWTARHKASLFEPGTMIDLCGGLGVDAMAFMEAGFEVTYNDADPVKAALFAWNARWLGHEPVAVHARPAEALIDDLIASGQRVRYLFADPSRRHNGKRLVSLDACAPDIPALFPRLRQVADVLILKLAPQLNAPDLRDTFPGLQRRILMSLDRECKECLLFIDLHLDEEPFSPSAHCLTRRGVPFVITAERDRMLTPILKTAGQYLYDPDPAILLAGAGAALAQQFKLGVLSSSHRRLDKSHALLLSGDTLHRTFPGRIFAVHTQQPWSRSSVRKYLGEQGISKAHVWRCQTRASVSELRKMLDLQPGHEASCALVTLADGKQAFIHANPVSVG